MWPLTQTQQDRKEREGRKKTRKPTKQKETPKRKKKESKKDTAKGRRGALSWEARVSSKAPWGTQLVGR
jgi:hypothetical protein